MIKLETSTDIETFLQRFHSYDSVDDVFTRGCCYWFAVILYSRFIRSGSTIMYDEIANHFGTMIGDKVYDITGDVTDHYLWKPWHLIEDPLLKEKIVRDCIMF